MKKNKEQLSLIDGRFRSSEAREIISNIFSAKISFHEMKNFSSMERLGKPDESAVRRIPELRNSLKEALNILNAAQKEDADILIHSVIEIQIADAK